MNETVDVKAMVSSSRGRVYLLWAAICLVGFVWTHYYLNANINIIWTILSAVGLIYMFKVMPLKVPQMKQIYLSWLVPIFIGMAWSVIAVRTELIPDLVPYLGAFWLIVMAAGFFWNGLVDGPGLWYYVAAAVNLVAGILVYTVADFYVVQYLIAAIVSTWAMLMLWVWRADT